MTPKLSDAQRRAMFLLRDGKTIDDGLYGRSQMGGLHGTWQSLLRLGFIDNRTELTEAGRAWLKAVEEGGAP